MDARASRRPDATLIAFGVLGIGVVLWFGAGIGGSFSQALVGWTLLAALQGFFASTAWRVARVTSSRAVRRLWSTCVLGGTMFVVGDLLQLRQILLGAHDPASLLDGDAHALTLGIGTAAMLVGMLSSPAAITAPEARARYRLDVATVMAAAASIGLYAVDLPGGGDAGQSLGQQLVLTVTGPAVLLVAVLAMIKLLMGGNPPFTRDTGLICGLAAGAQAVIQALPEGWAAAHGGWVMGIASLSSLVFAAGGRVQLLQGATAVHRPVRDNGPRTSLVPYLAIVATYALLITDLVVNGLNPHSWILLIGTMVCSVLVWGRQLAVFRQVAVLSERLREQAFHDALTGLPNRALFMRRLAEAQRPTVFLIDLDEFKPVNDRYGHAAGDRLLQVAADRLRALVRETDTVARLGGDEFAILADQLEPDRKNEVLALLSRALHDDVQLGEALVPLRASVGAAMAGESLNADELLHEADMAMYACKRRRLVSRDERRALRLG